LFELRIAMSSSAALTTSSALTPAGTCVGWRPDFAWLPVAADGLTALAYWSVPIALALALRRRRRRALVTWSAAAIPVAAFAAAAGAAHAASAVAFWRPERVLHGAAEAATGLAMVAAAVAFLPLLPRLTSMSSAAALTTANTLLRREVADTRDAQQRAASDRARLEWLFEHLSDALFVVRRSEAGRFVFETANPSFCRLFGRPCDAVEGTGPDLLLQPEAAAELERRFAACLAAGRPLEWDSPGRVGVPAGGSAVGGGGGAHHWHTVLVPLPVGADGAPRLLGSLRDVTELRRLQTDLVEQARRATIAAMCAGLAHEMSQPVNIIALWADRARSGLDPALIRPRRAMDIVSEQTRRLGTLLERMRDLVRDVPEEVEDFSAAPSLAAVVEVAQRAWALEGLAISLEVSTPLPLRGRPSQFEQSVLHLLQNAREAILRRRQAEPDAPARIAVRLSPGAAPGTVAVSVRDTGGGVAASVAPHILDPFVTSKEPGQGTGLGLPIAAGIARGMGGRLSWSNVASGRPDAGAVFSMVFASAANEAAARGRAA
jgi:PAS domain S-box-containing protein